jgi:3-phenylpropionate/trans-cinnamate dioxygenase ferredoxin subunit
MTWIHVCDDDELDMEDAIRVDHAGRSYAVYLTDEGEAFCTAGLCPLDGAHLAGGILEGTLIECPNHGGLFDIRDGLCKTDPACPPLATHPVRQTVGHIEVDLPD